MDYGKDILNRLIDMYERRGAFDKDASSLRAIQIEVKKVYPAYVDRYNHEAYKDINVAIEKLCVEEFVFAEKNSAGQYSKVRLNIAGVSECYRKLKRTSIPEQCEKVKKSLTEYSNNALLLSMLCDVLSSEKIVDETENGVASVTFILEHYIKTTIGKVFKNNISCQGIDIWKDTKRVAKWMYMNGEKQIDEKSLLSVINTGDNYLPSI